MLLLEWSHWLDKIVVFETEDHYALFNVAQLADSGWEIKDRDDRIKVWLDLIRRRRSKRMVAVDDDDDEGSADYVQGAVRRGARRAAEWIGGYMHGVKVALEKPKE